MTPTLSTTRLALRQLNLARKHHIEWLDDSEVVKFSDQRHKKHTTTSVQRYIDACSHIWGIYLVQDNSHVGNVTAHIDSPNSVADIGIMIGDKSLWGQGYGLEAWNAVCDWMLDEDGGGIRKLEGGCSSLNLGMRKIFERSKFQYEGERKLHYLHNGQQAGALLYGRFR